MDSMREGVNVQVEVFVSETKKGRGLRASSTITEGTTLLEEEPYAYILNEEELTLRCGHCLRGFTSDTISEAGLRVCGICKKAFYCSKLCQISGWSAHVHECKLLQGQSKDVPGINLRLLAKLIVKNKHLAKKTARSADHDGFPAKFDDLCSCKLMGMAQKYVLRLFRRYERGWRGKFRSKLAPLSSALVLGVFEKLKVNSFSMYDELQRSVIGEAVYLKASLFNHSCEPNCTFVFDGPKVMVRAIRRIEAGEECCISYVSSLLPTDLRQERLRGIYGFSCHCNRCVDTLKDNVMFSIKCPSMTCSAPVVPSRDGIFQTCVSCQSRVVNEERAIAVQGMEAFSEKILQEVEESQQEKRSINSYQNDSRLSVILRQCIRQQLSLLHPTHHCAIRVNIQAMKMYSRLGRWKDALEVGQSILGSLRLHLRPEDPYFGFHLLNLSIIHANLDDTCMTERLLDQAIPLLEIAYGENHAVTQYARQLEQDKHTIKS